MGRQLKGTQYTIFMLYIYSYIYIYLYLSVFLIIRLCIYISRPEGRLPTRPKQVGRQFKGKKYEIFMIRIYSYIYSSLSLSLFLSTYLSLVKVYIYIELKDAFQRGLNTWADNSRVRNMRYL